jgi:transcriptional regulator with XRE-family HTH domain
MGRFRVKELARARGLTSEELTHKSGLKISTVRNVWQNRVEDPASSTLRALASALGVTIEDLFDPAADGNGQAHTNGDGTKNRAPDIAVLA